MSRSTIAAMVTLLAVVSICLSSCSSRERTADHTFEDGTADRWQVVGAGQAAPDRNLPHDGQLSYRLTRDRSSEGRFISFGRTLPARFEGRALTLSGYVRAESLGVGSFVSLWVRTDVPAGTIALESTRCAADAGKPGWERYSATVAIPPDVERIAFGGRLEGSGSAWFDDLSVEVDKKPLTKASIRTTTPTAASRDSAFAHGSGLSAADLGRLDAADLALIGRVWGFLKYHHPAVAKGGVNMDAALFRLLHQQIAPGAEDARIALFEWASELGAWREEAPAPPVAAEVALTGDLAWVRDEGRLGADLSSLLQGIQERRGSARAHYYHSFGRGVGNTVFENEVRYDDLTPEDAGLRLLALFRFWNMIEFYFPYRDLIDEAWPDVLRSSIEPFLGAETREAYERACLELTARVDDTHCAVSGVARSLPPGGLCNVPVDVRFIGDLAVVFSVADSSDQPLRRGDVVHAVDGARVDSLVAAWRPFYGSSNEPTRRRDLGRNLLRGGAGPVVLRIERSGASFDVEVERVPLDPPAFRWPHDRPGETFQRISEEVAYLKFSAVRQRGVDRYLEQARGAKGWILDLRNYPSEFMVFALGRRLLAERTPFASFTRPTPGHPGMFGWGAPIELKPKAPRFEGRVVILIDETTQSQAEYTTMAFRAAPDAIVIGSTTAGADGNVSSIVLPGGLQTRLTGIGVFYPDRSPTQQVGIVPDIVVRPTLQGVRQGKDEVFERAVAEISRPTVLRD